MQMEVDRDQRGSGALPPPAIFGAPFVADEPTSPHGSEEQAELAASDKDDEVDKLRFMGGQQRSRGSRTATYQMISRTAKAQVNDMIKFFGDIWGGIRTLYQQIAGWL